MKYEEIVQQFKSNVFGTLTTIRSQKEDGKIWFIGKEIQEFLGHTNITQAVKDAKLNSDEIFILSKSINSGFWNEFVTKEHLVTKIRNITFISESGLYKLIMRSNKLEAEIFSDWVTREVLPNLRKSVEENLNLKYIYGEIGKHLDSKYQKFQSKRINKININSGGVNKAIAYNINSCLDHSNKTPAQIKTWAKKNGMPASKRTSAKEVFRFVDKPTACSMSLTDSLTASGVEYNKAFKISVGAGKELFKQLLDIGVQPKELEM